MDKPARRLPRRTAAAALLAAGAAFTAAAGCAGPGYLAYALQGDTRKVDVEAEYRGLDNKTVAVIVAGDPYVESQYPTAVKSTTQAVTGDIVQAVPGVRVTDPRKVAKYVEDHPYWITLPPGEVREALGVERLVVVELSEYRTNEPGNAYLWQGAIAATVNVLEEGNGDDFSYRQYVEARFPEDSTIGVTNADPQSIQLGMLTLFAEKVAGLFHDHTIEVKN